MIDYRSLPQEPGCYLYKNSAGTIIYVGKAKNLRKRVGSYFTKNHPDEKTAELVKNIRDIDFFITTNEVEALILENNLIKKHKPKYNIDLKDSRRYAYIALTHEKYPRLVVARQKMKNATLFGPFVNAEQRDTIIKLLRAKFQIRTCNKLPKRECLRYHINLCSGPCIGEISETKYGEGITHIDSFLKGKTKEVSQKLKGQMKSYSDSLQFEKAKIVRDQIRAIDFLNEKQEVESDKTYDEDIINYIIEEGVVYIIVFNAVRGVLTSKHEFSFEEREGFLEQFISQFYSEHKVPKDIVVPRLLKDPAVRYYLEKLRGKRVTLSVPKYGHKRELLDLVKRNVELSFLRENKQLEDLQKSLQLNGLPQVIECFDIAHISGTSSVGSMVQFRHAKPDKSNYRRFKIKTVEGNDDFSSIAEVVSRRYNRLKKEGLNMPDLIVIDGGKGQLGAALDVLRELELRIPIISLAKQEEDVFVPGLSTPLPIDKKSSGLQLLRQLRDEAHRFGQKYHKLLRSKRMLGKE